MDIVLRSSLFIFHCSFFIVHFSFFYIIFPFKPSWSVKIVGAFFFMKKSLQNICFSVEFTLPLWVV